MLMRVMSWIEKKGQFDAHGAATGGDGDEVQATARAGHG